jgi:hypothetical protein
MQRGNFLGGVITKIPALTREINKVMHVALNNRHEQTKLVRGSPSINQDVQLELYAII